MKCELCGKEAEEFGDVGGAIVCSGCLGWYGGTPDSEVIRLQKEGEDNDSQHH